MGVTVETSPLAGQFEHIVGGDAVGWVVDRDDPGKPVAVELVVDGEVVAECLAAQARPDVAQAFGVEGAFGFKLSGDLDLWNTPNDVTVQVKGTAETVEKLQSFSVSSVPLPECGQVVRARGGSIFGWATAGDGRIPAELDVFVDGTLHGQASASLSRLVVDGSGDGARSGFRYTIVLPVGEQHAVSLRFRSGVEIGNSPFILTGEEAVVEQPAPVAVSATPALSFVGFKLGLLRFPDGGNPAGRRKRSVKFPEQPLAVLDVFSRLSGVDPASAISMSGGSAAAAALETLRAVRTEPPPSLKSCGFEPGSGAAVFTVDDVWFGDEGALRLRLSAGLAPSGQVADTMRFVQLDIATGKAFSGGKVFLRRELAIVDAKLLNPFLPLLLVCMAEDNAILGVAYLPFPSLCRGGAHYAELSAAGNWPSYMTGLRRLSDRLARETLGWRTGGLRPSVGRLRVDMRGAKGAEKLFSPEAKEWLTKLLGFSLEPVPADVPAAPLLAGEEAAAQAGDAEPLAEERATAATPPARGDLVLTVPADALPTLSSLLSSQLSIPTGWKASAGSFVVADARVGAPLLKVSMPPMDAFLLSLQPAHAPLPFPILAHETGSDGAVPMGGVLPIPLAVRFHETQPRETSLAFPTPQGAPMIGAGGTGAGGDVSVLLPLGRDPSAALAFLRSLSAQTAAERIDVIAFATADGTDLQQAPEALAETFPNRHAIVEASGSFNARVNQAALAARGRWLLLCGEGVVLYDPRTVEALAALGSGERVATSACMMLREVGAADAATVTFASGGFFPTSVSFLHPPYLSFRETEVAAAAFPLATYPVAANSFRLVLVDTEVWRGLEGLDAEAFPAIGHDLDFCLRAGAQGMLHLCTSGVAALDKGGPVPGEQADALGFGMMPAQRWQEIFERSALVQELR